MQTVRMVRKAIGPFNLNTYFLSCRKTGRTLVIDPGGDAGDLANFLFSEKMIPERILMTHGHADHLFSMEKFKQYHDIPYCIHSADDAFFKKSGVRGKTRRMVGLPPPHPADVLLEDGDRIRFGEAAANVIHTPGHTPGSVCYLCEGHLYTGDAIFVGEAGRVDLPGGNLDLLVNSIQTRIIPLDPQTVIHPGHYHTGDAYSSTIEKEIKTNIYITDFILD